MAQGTITITTNTTYPLTTATKPYNVTDYKIELWYYIPSGGTFGGGGIVLEAQMQDGSWQAVQVAGSNVTYSTAANTVITLGIGSIGLPLRINVTGTTSPNSRVYWQDNRNV